MHISDTSRKSRTAFLILAHHQPEHLARLVHSLSADWNDIYIHIDRKRDIGAFRSKIYPEDSVEFLSTDQRIEVNWGGFSVVEAILSLISAALESGQQHDRFCLLSGADYPVKSLEDIQSAFATDTEYMRVDRFIGAGSDNTHSRLARYWYFVDQAGAPGIPENGFIQREVYDHIPLYHGSAWWALRYPCIGYVIDYLQEHSEYIDFHRHSFCPDEVFFHSIIKHSPYADCLSHDFEREADLTGFMRSNVHGCHYIDWNTPAASHPKVLNVEDACDLHRSAALFARKFDPQSGLLLDMLDKYIVDNGPDNPDEISETTVIDNQHEIKQRIWVVGDGRSGTTWLSELINYENRYQYIFEPFHPWRSKEMAAYGLFKYLRPDDEDHTLVDFSHRVFSSKVFTDDSTVAATLRLCPEKILVKDIFAHLITKWMIKNNHGIKVVIILRHPFAVALSKEKLGNYNWMREPAYFLEQLDLYSDYLQPFVNIIERAVSGFEKQVTIWAVIHYVMFQMLEDSDYHLVYYEDLCRHPEKELSGIMDYLDEERGAVAQAMKKYRQGQQVLISVRI